MVSEKQKEKEKKSNGFTIGVVILALIIFTLIVMGINSRKPDFIEPAKQETKVKGAAFIRTNQILIEQFAGNWLPNDIFWPTVLLDNMPNFQIGELEVVRYNVRVLRDSLSRMRTTDKLDARAEGAFTALSNDPYKWWFPSAEKRWKKAYNDLEMFYQGLASGKSHFYPRADNLVVLLKEYISLMGGVNTRLINAPKRKEKVIVLEEDKEKGAREVELDLPWYEIDDNFYYAQGVAYALYESFKAIRVDFKAVLKNKNSTLLVDKILEGLKKCYFEPLFVFNGSTGSIFANHSLNLSGMFNDARQKIDSLTFALKDG
jgi:hypothetical protein